MTKTATTHRTYVTRATYGYGYRVICLCGWKSDNTQTQANAQMIAAQHERESR